MGAKRADQTNVNQDENKTVRIAVYVSPDLYDRLSKVIAYKHFKAMTDNTMSGYIGEELLIPHIEQIESEMKSKKQVAV